MRRHARKTNRDSGREPQPADRIGISISCNRGSPDFKQHRDCRTPRYSRNRRGGHRDPAERYATSGRIASARCGSGQRVGRCRQRAFLQAGNGGRWLGLVFHGRRIESQRAWIDRANAVCKALTKLTRKARARNCNALEITRITCRRFFGVSCVSIAVHLRHLQKGRRFRQMIPVKTAHRSAARVSRHRADSLQSEQSSDSSRYLEGRIFDLTLAFLAGRTSLRFVTQLPSSPLPAMYPARASSLL